MPELQNRRIAAEPNATQGASDGHYEKLPTRSVTVEEMLAASLAGEGGAGDISTPTSQGALPAGTSDIQVEASMEDKGAGNSGLKSGKRKGGREKAKLKRDQGGGKRTRSSK